MGRGTARQQGMMDPGRFRPQVANTYLPGCNSPWPVRVPWSGSVGARQCWAWVCQACCCFFAASLSSARCL